MQAISQTGGWYVARCSAVALVALVGATVHAGLIHTWTISELAQAPVLAVCTVEEIAKREPVAAGTVRWTGSHRWHEATLRVERVHSKLARAPVRGDRITVRYVSDGDNRRFVSGSPIWPVFVKGQRAVFPLSPSPWRSGQWSLAAEEGMHITVPATGKEWRRAGVSTPRDFAVTELINAVANGSPAEQCEASRYLGESFAFPTEAQGLLDAAIGNDEERWLGVAAAMVSSHGMPGPNLAEIMAGGKEGDAVRRPIELLLAHALQKGVKRDFPGRLIVKLIDDAPVHTWGSATALVPFKDSPVLIDYLGDALRRGRTGAVTIAWFLARNGQRSLLPDALAAAQKLVMNPGTAHGSELQAASGLIRDYGDDARFGALLATLRRLRTTDMEQYRKLFSAAAYSLNKRGIALAAVLMDDKREGYPPRRFCDIAASELQRLSGQNFGIVPNMTRSDWDRAVRRARDWLARTGGLSH